jgi:hypothetical protein
MSHLATAIHGETELGLKFIASGETMNGVGG